MFGYVTVCADTLSESAREDFRAYYCGLCRATGRRCSQAARLGLSYDITFLAIVLSSLTDGDTARTERACMLHPLKKRPDICGEAVAYSADMGTILTYLKLLDDFHDEKNIKSLFLSLLFRRGARRAQKRYPEVSVEIKKCLSRLSELEKNGCAEIDETADCFAHILEILFTPAFVTDENERRALAWLGYNIGRWIYIIDAYNDLEKDIKKGSYNTLICRHPNADADMIRERERENLTLSMLLTLENAESAYNLLNIKKNKEILDNIIHTSLLMKQNNILNNNMGEKNESI